MPPAVTWLIRHGQSSINAGRPSVAGGDVCLTELGVEQAAAVAHRVDRPPDLLIMSPLVRARATADLIRAQWPTTPYEIWPIQELNYLSPARCGGTTAATRRPMIDAYWQRCDPDYLDGPDAESFSDFLHRVRQFHERLVALDCRFVVAVGHGQFFRAYTIAMATGFAASPEWMAHYRRSETANPLANCEVVELSGEALRGVN